MPHPKEKEKQKCIPSTVTSAPLRSEAFMSLYYYQQKLRTSQIPIADRESGINCLQKKVSQNYNAIWCFQLRNCVGLCRKTTYWCPFQKSHPTLQGAFKHEKAEGKQSLLLLLYTARSYRLNPASIFARKLYYQIFGKISNIIAIIA